MVTDLAVQNEAQLMESVLLNGDLSKLSPAQRVSYYRQVCDSIGVNPLTKPFDYITLNGKLTLYARKDATDQIRASRKVSITELTKQFVDDLYIVTAHAVTPDGRTDASTGAVTIGNLKGDAKANAIMKAETKAKRRVTLSICGLGWLDETEVQTIPDARPVVVNDGGEIVATVATVAPETTNQETGEPSEPVQMFKYNDAVIVNAVRKIMNYSIQETAALMSETHKQGKIGTNLTVAEAEAFARNLIAPK